MASDGVSGVRAARKKGPDVGFKWVSSSPSPAEVKQLEFRFSAVVQVPMSMLEAEAEAWQQRAVIARSFLKWVPGDAYVREFRRAGISGAIVPVSLACRCHIFRFEDPAACDLVLNLPWVINGQLIGFEAWRPEFFPAEDSVASALVWLRMPNLPLEFWREDILRIIAEPSGIFSGVDAATSARSRGGFARVAIRVDLRNPLRPGTRV